MDQPDLSFSFVVNDFIFAFYLALTALGLRGCTCRLFSSCSAELFFIAMHKLLTATASLVADHGLSVQLAQLWLVDSGEWAQ